MSKRFSMFPVSTRPAANMILALPVFLILSLPGAAGCREEIGLEEILDRVHMANEASQDSLSNYACQSTFIMLEPQKDGAAKTVLVQDKTVFFRSPDQKREIFRSITKKGQVLSPEELAEYQQKADQEALRMIAGEDAAKGESSEKNEATLAFTASAPWDPEEREHYTFELLPPDTIRGIPAYTVKVVPREKDEDLVDGTVWFHQDRFEVLRLEFQPAKNPRFVKKARVILDFAEVQPGYWLPVEMKMDVSGGFLFIKKSFLMHQTWRDYQVNTGLPDSLFLAIE
jgi:outer membrane lipoprotein-sorting protein